MRRLLRWYGAGPLNLLALLACFALAGYAAARLVPSHPLGVAVWFIGAAVGHDLVLVPLYSLADRSALAVLRHRAPALPSVAWVNYVRVPAALSGLLLLVWFPLILRLTGAYQASTTLSPAPYLWHWLAVTGALFLLSAVAFAFRLRAARATGPIPAIPAGPVPGGGRQVTQADRGQPVERAGGQAESQPPRPAGRLRPLEGEAEGATGAATGQSHEYLADDGHRMIPDDSPGDAAQPPATGQTDLGRLRPDA